MLWLYCLFCFALWLSLGKSATSYLVGLGLCSAVRNLYMHWFVAFNKERYLFEDVVRYKENFH